MVRGPPRSSTAERERDLRSAPVLIRSENSSRVCAPRLAHAGDGDGGGGGSGWARLPDGSKRVAAYPLGTALASFSRLPLALGLQAPQGPSPRGQGPPPGQDRHSGQSEAEGLSRGSGGGKSVGGEGGALQAEAWLGVPGLPRPAGDVLRTRALQEAPEISGRLHHLHQDPLPPAAWAPAAQSHA